MARNVIVLIAGLGGMACGGRWTLNPAGRSFDAGVVTPEAGSPACANKTQFYFDADEDGFGTKDKVIEACLPVAGHVPNDLDCDDSQRDIHPGAAELCDNLDNNCDGRKDEDFDLTGDSAHCGACNLRCPESTACLNATCSSPQTIVQIDAGRTTTCARRLDGKTECWGGNPFGNLGIGEAVAHCKTSDGEVLGWCSNQPLPVGTFASVSVGRDHACAVVPTAPTTVVCWGSDASGRLGQQTIRSTVSCADTSEPCQRTPAPLVTVSDVRSVEVGYLHACAITTHRQLVCWGANTRRQLGAGVLSENEVTARTVVDGSTPLENVTQVALGDYHTCAAQESGGVRCWGDDTNGQLGQGSTKVPDCIRDLVRCLDRPTPVQGLDGVITRLVAGSDFTCALEQATGRVFCWGGNVKGQLGVGDTQPRSVPTEVKLPVGARFKDIAAGGYHACALAENGDVYCWGNNESDACCPGYANPNLMPGKVARVSRALQLAAGSLHTCARVAVGVLCWGNNMWGQLGNRDNADTGTPQTVLFP